MSERRCITAIAMAAVLILGPGCLGPVHLHFYERHVHQGAATKTSEAGSSANDKARSYIDSLIGDEDVFETVPQ